MELEIRPEPGSAERQAILAVLEKLDRDGLPAPYRSAWHMEGIRENVEEPAEDD